VPLKDLEAYEAAIARRFHIQIACTLYKQPSQVRAPALADAEQLLLASG
jgi:hypothetical protein